MNRTTVRVQMLAAALPFVVMGQAAAQSEGSPLESPRWTYEFRAGTYTPDLPLFDIFYGDASEGYYGLAGSYRLRDWLELGGEYGHMTAKGVGLLTESQALGGTVEYRLNPIHIFANFILQRSVAQRVVPYIGIGLAVATYDQDVDLQGSREGRTDAGHSARIGVRFRLGTHGPASTSDFGGSPFWRSFLFLEAQTISTEVDGVELGGDAYSLGFRMEFDFSRS